jgi:broad specificity phosphatase PhoE
VHWTGIPPLEFRPPGGETIHEVRDRVRSFLTELPETNEMTTILIVAHQVVLSLIRVEFDNLRIEDLWQIRQEPGQIIELNPARRARRNGESE